MKLSGSWETVTPSRFHADWLSSAHAHPWFRSKRSGAYALGINKWNLTNLGISLPQWLKHYESDDGFRNWIRQRVMDGDLSQAELLNAAKPEYFASSGRLPNLGDAWHWKYEDSLGTRH